MAQAHSAQMLELHIAPGGSDQQAGTRQQPLATLAGARAAIRRKRQAGALPAGGAVVTIAEGHYQLEETLLLEEQDSGTAAGPIIYRAAGAGVHVRGGKALTGLTPVTDPQTLERLDPQVRGRVLQVDLASCGVRDWGTLRGRGFGRGNQPAHLELFFQGKPMTVARYPNQGYVQISGMGDPDPEPDGHGGKVGALDKGFNIADERLQRWREPAQAWAYGYWAWDWANTYEQVERIDLESGLVLTRPPHGLYGFRPGQRVYFLNILEELDSPGEYYVDGQRGVLYFYPPAPLENGELAVSVLEGPMLHLRGVHHVRIEGLTLEYSRGSGVLIEEGSDCLVAGCTLANLGNAGVLIRGGERHGVQSCDIYQTGDGGVDVNGGDRASLRPCGHFVDNCHFHHQARWSGCYHPAVHAVGVGVRISHNLMHDHPHCPLLFSGNEHVVEFNHIHHVCYDTGDVGAIYTGRDYTFQGNVVRYNFLHDTGGMGMGSMGVYLDDCVSGIEIRGNVFYKVQRAAFIGGGRDITVEGNLFVDCDPAVQIDARGLSPAPVWRNMIEQTMKERYLEMRPDQEPYRSRYPHLAAVWPYLNQGGGAPPGNVHIQNNVCVGPWLQIGWHALPEMIDVGSNFTSGDPGFVDPDPKHLNFQLRADGPARKAGFTPPPVEMMGVYVDLWRKSVADR